MQQDEVSPLTAPVWQADAYFVVKNSFQVRKLQECMAPTCCRSNMRQSHVGLHGAQHGVTHAYIHGLDAGQARLVRCI